MVDFSLATLILTNLLHFLLTRCVLKSLVHQRLSKQEKTITLRQAEKQCLRQAEEHFSSLSPGAEAGLLQMEWQCLPSC
jgi:hypothetical protein